MTECWNVLDVCYRDVRNHRDPKRANQNTTSNRCIRFIYIENLLFPIGAIYITDLIRSYFVVVFACIFLVVGVKVSNILLGIASFSALSSFTHMYMYIYHVCNFFVLTVSLCLWFAYTLHSAQI